MPAMIVLGDKTDHGGEVIEASGVTDTHGKRIARVGDKVQCPKKGHGTTIITTGDNTMLIDGKAAAYHGCKTSCGATLISSQSVTTVDFGGGSSSTQIESQRTSVEDKPLKFEFDEMIQAIDPVSGSPIAGIAYYIEAQNGQSYSGLTDAEGRCQRVDTQQAEELKVWFGEEAEQKQAR